MTEEKLQPKIATSARWWMLKDNWNLLMDCHTVLTSNSNEQQAPCLEKITTMIQVEGIIDYEDLSELVTKGLIGSDCVGDEQVTYDHLKQNAIIAGIPFGIEPHEMRSEWLDEHPELTCDEWKMRYDMPYRYLESDLKVYNFCSGHNFHFDDGSVLPAAHASRTNGLQATVIEQELQEHAPHGEGKALFTTINPGFELNRVTREALDRCLSVSSAYNHDYVVMLPLPILRAYQRENPQMTEADVPFRTGRVAVRASKGQPAILKSDRFYWKELEANK